METQIKTIVREVTPELAKELLSRNGVNRLLRDRKINQFLHDMINGNWYLTAQGISVSKTGRLIDGQHRLSAIIKYGKGVEMMITYGIDDAAFIAYDCGFNRTSGDVFHIMNIPNGNGVAAGIKKYLMRISNPDANYRQFKGNSTGGAYNAVYITHKDVINEYESNPVFWNNLFNTCAKCYSKYRLFQTPMLMGFCAYMSNIKEYKLDKVVQFINEVNGVNESTCDATRLLREVISRDKLSIKKLTALTMAALFNKAWNHYIKGSNLKLLKYDSEREEFPELI